MKTIYYITNLFIFVVSSETNTVEDKPNDMIQFMAHVYTPNTTNNGLCGHKIKDDVLVSIPNNTIRVVV